jgi:hypothetical protein
MSQKKKKKKTEEFECDCGHKQEVETEGYYNWKCDECKKINPFNKHGVGVVWKCDTGTAKRGN